VGRAPGPAAEPGFPALCALRFSADDLRQVRRMTAQWAAWAGLPASRADDFVIAVNEIATNAVRYGSAQARLLLRAAGRDLIEAEVRDDGRWQAPPGDGDAGSAGSAGGGWRRGGMGIPLARLICDRVDIRARPGGTTVTLRMRLPALRRAGGQRLPGPLPAARPTPVRWSCGRAVRRAPVGSSGRRRQCRRRWSVRVRAGLRRQRQPGADHHGRGGPRRGPSG
jgi:anti-sigma regulatory factor (Ser/Thr protein kinase)